MSERESGIRGWRLGMFAAAGVLGWALLILFLFSPPEWLDRTPELLPAHPSYEPATREGPPVIALRHLEDRGFDTATLELIEPHFRVLNAALVTIVESKADYEKADFAAHRDRLISDAIHFHTTADRHEEQIERLLSDELRVRFHDYVREREAAAGLHQDTLWHQHEDPAHRAPSPGFDAPRHTHGDSTARS